MMYDSLLNFQSVFFRHAVQLYQHEWKLGKREIVWKHDARRAECFRTISTSVDITIYQYGKNVLYLFYNIAQRNIKKEIARRFRVDTLSQSAFRIYKCSI